MSQDNRLLPLTPATAPLDRPLRELTQPDRPNNTYAMPEPTHLRDYLQVVLKRKWLILSLVVVVTALTAIQMYRQPSIYESVTTLQIEQKNKTVLKTPQLILNAGNDATYWPTQLKLLENPRLVRKVILALNLHNNPSFTGGQARAGLLTTLRRVVSREQPKAGAPAGQAEGGLSVVNDGADSAPVATDAELTPEQAAKLEGLENFIRANMTIAPVERTSLVELRFQHFDPPTAMLMTDAMAAAFIRDNFERETSGAREATDKLGQKIVELQNEITQKREQELAFKQKFNIPLNPTQGSNLSALKLTTSSSQMMEAEAKLHQVQSQYEAAQAALAKPDGIFTIPAVEEDKNMQTYQQRLQELEQQKAALEVQYTSEWPGVKKVDKQIENVRAMMQRRAGEAVASLKNDYEAARKNVEKVRADYGRARGEVNAASIAETRLGNLQSELETTRQLYNTALQKQKELEMAGSDLNSNITIATPARTPRLVGPPRVRNILIALLLSLGAGIGLAFLLDYLDDTLKSIEDVDRHLHLPTLALIPAPREARKFLPARGGAAAAAAASAAAEPVTALALIDEVRSPVTEAYRHLRTSLLLSSAGQPPRTVLVTSSQPSEGKTTTAVNTAVMLAQTGAEVLLLDCDLRRPRIHAHFGLGNARGVTNYLSGESDVSSLVQQYDKVPSLKIITSGPVPPNAAELLGSEEMRRLVSLLSENFTHVIIDSPPAISFTDASILSTMVDGVMLVVHGGRSSRAVVRRAKQQLMDVGAHIFGIVLNNVKLESSDYYYYAGYYSNYYAGDEDAPAPAAGEGASAK
jgi:succinoglycan biosynthesis transport protein ExoP